MLEDGPGEAGTYPKNLRPHLTVGHESMVAFKWSHPLSTFLTPKEQIKVMTDVVKAYVFTARELKDGGDCIHFF